jgi:hypothetical protein
MKRENVAPQLQSQLENVLLLGLRDLDENAGYLSLREISEQYQKEHAAYKMPELGIVVLAQVQTRAPRNISEFITPQMKLQMLSLFQKYVTEHFEDTATTSTATAVYPLDLLNSSDKLEVDTILLNSMSHQQFNDEQLEMQKQREYVSAVDIDHYQHGQQQNMQVSSDSDIAQYVETAPVIMKGRDVQTGNEQYYYYDKVSGSLTELPLSNTSVQISKNKLEHLMKTANITIDDAVVRLTAPQTAVDDTIVQSTDNSHGGSAVIPSSWGLWGSAVTPNNSTQSVTTVPQTTGKIEKIATAVRQSKSKIYAIVGGVIIGVFLLIVIIMFIVNRYNVAAQPHNVY